jgi:hypothetical protein
VTEKEDDLFEEHAGGQAPSSESEGCHMHDDLGAINIARVLLNLIQMMSK